MMVKSHERVRERVLRGACIAAVVLLTASCSKSDQPAAPATEKVLTNVSYGPSAAQVMDLYLPAGRKDSVTPWLVLVHGGAWVSGDKSDFAPYIDSIRKFMPGYAIANLNYRLASFNTNFFPTQEKDVDSAVQFLLRHTASYGVSSRFVLLGVSAGGQLALLQAYKYTHPPAAAVVSFFGPTDMADLYVHSPDTALIGHLPLIMGGTPHQNPALYQHSSPLHYVSAASCATLLLQGGKDPLVPAAEAFYLRDTLKALHVPAQLVYYPDDGHGWYGSDLEDSFRKIASFLQAHGPQGAGLIVP
jgi:acetyl esterase/lipase